MRRQYAVFCDAYIAPLLGPRPSEYKGIRPTSYVSAFITDYARHNVHIFDTMQMGDDGSPIEYSWVIESEDKMAVRFTVEPLSVVDGSPSPPETWMSSLRGLGRFTSSPDFDISWSQTCFDSLGCIPPSNSNLMQQTNCRFFLGKHTTERIYFVKELNCYNYRIQGTNFTSDGILGKSYFLPNFPSRDMEVSNRQLVTVCMERLGLENPWRMVLSYIAQLPAHHQATLPIVSVDCIIPSKNRAKVYIRTQASSLRAIIDLMTLGGELSSPSILSTIATLRHLWRLLFDGIDEDIPLPSRAPDHYATGFPFYFEMSLRDPSPAPKVYIPVRFYCQNDRKVAEALVQYYKDFGISSVGDSYM